LTCGWWCGIIISSRGKQKEIIIMKSIFESVKTVDFGDIRLVDNSKITKYDDYIGFIDGSRDCEAYDVYRLASGECVAVVADC
jgi:hypothetical protein